MWAIRAGVVSSIGLAVAITVVVVSDPADQNNRAAAPGPADEPPVHRLQDHEPVNVDCTPEVDRELVGDEAVLAAYWRTRRPCDELPRCSDPAPVMRLEADLDPSPGIERVIASKRFGVAMTTPTGQLLGFHVTECGRRGPEGEYLELSTRNFTGGSRTQLTVRERRFERCRELLSLTVLRRSGHELMPILEIDEGGERRCDSWQGVEQTWLDVRPGEVDVYYAGWEREATEATDGELGPLRAVNRVCRLRLGDDGWFEPLGHTCD